MTQMQLLNANKSLLNLMRTNSMRVKDIELAELVSKANEMREMGEKKTYIVQYLSEQYGISVRSVYMAINKLNKEIFE